jgi:hypothetical protein
MSKERISEVPEMFTIEQSSENPEKWYIKHRIPDKGYLLRSGQLSRNIGPTGDWSDYHNSQQEATDFALAMERIPLREVCQRCGRPFATIHDVRAAQLFGLCPTRYAPRDPDAAKDCERNVLKAVPPDLGKSPLKPPVLIHHLFAYVQAMIDENVPHRTKPFRLGEMKWSDAAKHLIDESEEARLATDRDSKCIELADALGVLIHMACILRMTDSELIALCLHKLALRFEIPQAVELMTMAIDMAKPDSEHTVYYQINTETLEIEDITRTVQAAEEECLKDELTSILFNNVRDLDVFTASAAAMLAKSYFNLKREKEAKSGQGSSTQPAV